MILAFINYIFNVDIVNIGTCTSIFFGLTTIYLTGILSLLIKQEKILPQIITATSVPLLYWSFGALEISIVSATILFLLITTIKFSSKQTKNNYFLCVISIFLYLIVRPEAFFVISLFLFIPLSIFFFRNEKYSSFSILFITTIILFSAIVVFRYNYFGAFFPQPVEAKIGKSLLKKTYSGLFYYRKSLMHYPLFLLFVMPLVINITIKYKQTI